MNQGNVPGHEAYGAEFATFNQGVNDARIAAILNAGQEQNRLFGLEQAARTQGLNEVLGLAGAGRLNLPDFQGSPQTGVQGTDVIGAYNAKHAADLNAWNNINQQNAQARSDLFGLGGALGGAAIAASSKDYKHDHGEAPEVLEAIKDLPVKKWSYKPEMALGTEEHVGPMAEQWKAATGLGDGKSINLLDAFGVVLKAIQELTAKVDKLEARYGMG